MTAETSPKPIFVHLEGRTFIVRFDAEGRWANIVERVWREPEGLAPGYFFNRSVINRRNYGSPSRGLAARVLGEALRRFAKRPMEDAHGR